MRIKQITDQIRRDFTAIYECQHCGHTHKGGGYDDAHFHNTVVPQMECTECGKAGGDDTPHTPKYTADQVV